MNQQHLFRFAWVNVVHADVTNKQTGDEATLICKLVLMSDDEGGEGAMKTSGFIPETL